MNLLLVILGAAIGAPLRHAVDRAVATATGAGMPLGTLAVNVTGSLLLGLLLGADVPEPVTLLAGVGFCGAFTTYSTFTLGAVTMWEERRHVAAALYVSVTLVAGIAAAVAGWAIGQRLGT